MLRTLAISLILLFSPVLNSCEKTREETTVPDNSQEEQQEQENEQQVESAGKTLIAYYSFSGDCRSIVASITTNMAADVLEIHPAEEGLDYAANNYAIGSSLIAAIREKPNNAASYPAIKPVKRNVADYDTVIIVTPLWWSNMAAPMQSYLFQEGNKMAGKTIGLIVSSYSSGISSVVADAKRLIPEGKFVKESLWINNSNRSGKDALVKNWLSLFINQSTMPEHIKISVGGKTIPIAIEDNNATKELVKALRKAPVSYEANDYGGFEKVGDLGFSLPASDTQITTGPGDVILYSGNQIVLFYGTNTWSYTRIGKMEYGTLDELKAFLKAGQGMITVTLSL
ncbi:MAG: NAD(P)H-dependent oxidoreductase [Bacteroidales bacterium]|nr:NAD(P)H-dependent oxidoreductase [Bacteroidales bacterium]